MNKCLVTTLKASTNNEALSKYNVLTIKTKASDSPTENTQWINIGASENGGISVNSPSVGLYKSGISGELLPYPYTVIANGSIASHFENKDGIIEVTGKYNISRIVVGSNATLRVKEIYGIPGTITRLTIGKIEEREVDANKLRSALDLGKLTNINLANTVNGVTQDAYMFNRLNKNTIGEFKAINEINRTFCLLFDSIGLDDIANNVSVTQIASSLLNAGNLSSLAKLTNLKTISFSDYTQNTGDIMDFINPWIQAGRTSGKINVKWLLGQKNITLNGQPISYPSGVSSSNAYLNWTSDGTVTFTAS